LTLGKYLPKLGCTAELQIRASLFEYAASPLKPPIQQLSSGKLESLEGQ